MTKDHFIPRFIIKNFSDSEGNIRFYNKETGIVSNKVWRYTQLQKYNFHSKLTLSELKELFPDIKINPIFEDTNKKLEPALNDYLEKKMSSIVDEIVKKNDNAIKVTLSEEEKEFIKEYIAIQHIRTLKFKMLSKDFYKKFYGFSEIKNMVIEADNNRQIDIKTIIKQNNPHLDHKARRELEVKYKRKLNKNPDLIKEIRQQLFSENWFDELIKTAEENIKDIINNPERHSATIINRKQRDSFFKKIKIENKDVKILLNQTGTPFVLGDTGMVIMADDPELKNNLEVFLPIHPEIVIGLTSSEKALVDDNFVVTFNRFAKEDSYKNVYSTSEKTLNSLK